MSRRLLELPEPIDVVAPEIFPDRLAIVCVILVLTNALRGDGVFEAKKASAQFTTFAVAILGVVIGLIVLPDTTLITFLVHLATQGIEFAQPSRFQRLGNYPNHAAEGFRLFWLSVAAVAAVALAAALLVVANCKSLTRKQTAALITVQSVCLVAATAFCTWYFAVEFQRVSPDLASVGRGTNLFELLLGAILAVIVITAGAHQLSISTASTLTTFPATMQCRPFYQSIFWILMLVASIVTSMYENIRGSYAITQGLFFRDIIEWIGSMLVYSSNYLDLAVVALSLQLCWSIWKHGTKRPPIALYPVQYGRFIVNWLALALIVVVGVPTMSIYCFAFWLGPFYLFGL